MSLTHDHQNLSTIIKHNRKIVQRAFLRSSANTQYQFPKTKLNHDTYSQISDSLSLYSKVSQSYDLHQQNLYNLHLNTKNKINNQYSQIPKSVNGKQEFQLNIIEQKMKNQNNKRRYLSLTPKKDNQISHLSQKNIQNNHGINLTTKRIQRKSNYQRKQNSLGQINNKSNQFIEYDFIKDLKRVTSRCFGSQNVNIKQKQQTQAIFYNQEIIYSKQNYDKHTKINNSNSFTADETPLINQLQNSISNNRKLGKSKIKMQQNIVISPFIYS